MKSFEKNYSKIISALKAAYLKKEHTSYETAEDGDQWDRETMRRIRILESGRSVESMISLIEQAVWRMAPVFGILIICLAYLISQIDFGMEMEMAIIIIDNPVEPGLFYPPDAK